MENEKKAEELQTQIDDGADEKKYIVRHNKEDVELTLQELIENAQKGLDYDRIRPSHDFVKELAAMEGESDIPRFIAKMKQRTGGAANAAQNPQPERDGALNPSEMEAIAREYPEFIKNGALELPEDAAVLVKCGVSPVEACRAADLKRTKELCAQLSARLDALLANSENNAASIGSLSGGAAPEKDFFTPQEWDRLPRREKEKFIKSGKIYEFMRKWSGK